MQADLSDSTKLGPMADRVYQAILSDIQTGSLAAHSRLPSERDLCERFKVNRGTLRKAMMRLVEDGRVSTRRGSGSHVCPVDQAQGTANIISVMCGATVPDLARLTSLALTHGYTLGIYAQDATKYDSEIERLFLERVKQQRHQALLAACTPTLPHHDELLMELVDNGTRVLHTEPYRLEEPDQDFLMPDYTRAGRAATTSLLLDGFRRIIYVGMPEDGPGYQLTRLGVEETLVDQGLAKRPLIGIKQDSAAGNFFRIVPGNQSDYGQRLDDLAQSITGPVGFVVPGLKRAQRIREAVTQRNVKHRTRVIGVEVTVSESQFYIAGDTCTFDRRAIFQQAIEHVSRPRQSSIRQWVSPSLEPTASR